MSEKVEGKVKWFNRKKGYGFIESEDGKEYFVHYTAVERGTFLRDDDVVSFEPAETDKGKQAQNVTLLTKASDLQGDEASAPAEEAADEPAEEVAEEPEAEVEEAVEEPAEEVAEEPEAEVEEAVEEPAEEEPKAKGKKKK